MIYFVTNICPHYRVRLFELLAETHTIRFFFFSDAAALRHWESRNPTALGAFEGEVIPPLRVGSFRFVPGLYSRLIRGRYEVLLKCINGKFPLLLSYLIAKARGIPFILWTELSRHPETFVHRLSFPVVRHIYRNADAVVAGGDQVREYLKSLGAPQDRIFVARQAVNHHLMGREVSPEECAALRRKLRAEGRKIVLYVGRLEPEKGITHLADAMREVAASIPATLVVAGEGSQREEIHRRTSDIPGLDAHFPGYVAQEALPAYYRTADVLVVPSVTTKAVTEVWGLVINEAMHQGCPVVTSASVGAVRGGLVVDGRNGSVVPERDPRALAAAIIRILTDPALRSRLSAGAREAVGGWTQENKAEGFRMAIEYALSRGAGGKGR